MVKMITYILNIDDIGKKIAGKVLFSVMFLLRCLTLLAPIGDNDFTSFYVFSDKVLADPDLFMNMSLSDIPITMGNLLYLFAEMTIDFLMVMGAVAYCALYIRDHRKKYQIPAVASKLKPIPVSELVARLFLFALFAVIIYIPFLTMVLYLPIIFIIIFPCVILYPACYLSGDSGFFKSFPETIRKTKGFYLVISRDISTVLLVYFAVQIVLSLIAERLPVINYVLLPFLLTYVLLVVGRYVGFVYCRITELKGFFIKRKPFPMNNDASK